MSAKFFSYYYFLLKQNLIVWGLEDLIASSTKQLTSFFLDFLNK